MKKVQLKSFSGADQSQLHNLNFAAGGNMSKGASNRRVALRNKECDIIDHNFFSRLKNFCIDLSEGIFNEECFNNSLRSMNLFKHLVDELDYDKPFTFTLSSKVDRLKLFIQNYLPKKYLKLYYYNQKVIFDFYAPKIQEPEQIKEATQLNLFSYVQQ